MEGIFANYRAKKSPKRSVARTQPFVPAADVEWLRGAVTRSCFAVDVGNRSLGEPLDTDHDDPSKWSKDGDFNLRGRRCW